MNNPAKNAVAILFLVAGLAWPVSGASAEPVVSEANALTLAQHSYPRGLSSLMAITGTELDSPIVVQVRRGGQPASGEKVDFLISDTPPEAKGTRLVKQRVVTDTNGMARATLIVGDMEGKYLVTAYLNGTVKPVRPLTTAIEAMTPSWVMFLVFGLLGGLGLFLYGMNIASANLQRAAGEQMRVLIGKLTRTRISAVLVGTVASGVLQSSSAATVMLVGFVSAGMMTLTQAIGVTMGSKIGVTITIQVIAFDISQYALLVVGLGALGIMFAGPRERMKQIGSIVLGFGLIFFGLSIMSGVMKPMRGMPEVADLMIKFGDNAALAILAGAAVTAVIQSAVAMVAVCFVLASQGLLSLEAAIPLSIGGAIGTCTTALLASLGSNRKGKQVAIAHLLFSASAATVFYPFLGPLTDLTQWFTALFGSESIVRQIANGFMLFSILSAAVFLPLVGVIEKVARKIIPAAPEEAPFGPLYCNEAALQVPLMALDQAQKEVEHMVGLFGDILKGSIPAILNGDIAEIRRQRAETAKLDILEQAIRPFLAVLSQKGLSVADAAIERGLIYITEDFKVCGHLLSREVMQVGESMVESGRRFSKQGAGELATFHGKLVRKFKRIEEAVKNRDMGLAEQVLLLSFKEAQLHRSLRDSHLERVHAGGIETVESSGDHLAILAGMNAIRNKLDSVAKEILQEM